MSSLKVAVRVRPFNARENDMDAQLIVQMDGKKTRLLKPKLQSIRDVGRDNHHDFTFDYSYWSFDEHDSHFATQEEVYSDLGTDVIDCAYEGYNACVFAYGQTGSGKTFTMMGTPDNPGLIPRICQELFARMRVGQESGTGYKTHASYLEIYNERVKDLLGPHSAGHGLRVREHRTLGPYVENLSQHAVSNFEEIQECIARGNIQRTTASTNMNDTSSRSHAIFTITFVQAVFMNDMPSETVSKIHLVDLAGSERANATGATGQRLKEGAHINKSLVTLGSVISALAEQTSTTTVALASSPAQTKRVLYIPYRDSILTWLLKDSLGGNSKTIMIAALSPADCNYSETLSTLRYANRAKNIINKPTINEDTNVKLIRELREEINKLKSMLNGDINTVQPSLKVLEDLQKKEAQEKVLTEEWTEKWKEAQSILQEQKSLGLRKSGLGVVLDSEMPHLIGIHNDVTTGVTLYSLKEGETLIGTDDSETPQDIELIGDGICAQHCRIVLQEGIVILHPYPGAQCWLNAHLIDEPTHISQGDIILLGRTNIFRFNNPAEAAKLRKDLSRSQLDMSRLSLITSSRENLLTSSFYSEEDSMSGSMNASPFKRPERQYYPTKPMSRDDPELQDENRKILDTIENALKQLNIERVQMHDQYKAKVRKLTDELKRLETEEMDKLEILRCQEQELLARKDMLLWEKNNEKVQIDIVCRQISAFQTQLDSKKRDFSEYVAKELQELQDCGKLDEIGMKIEEFTPLSDQLLLQVADSLDLFASQFIKDTVKRNNDEIRKLDEKIMEKECILNESTKKIAQVDEKILQIQLQLDKLQNERHENESNSESMRQKKLEMNLNLTKTSSTNTDDSNIASDTYHTAQSNISVNSPTIVDDQISPLSTLSATSADLDDASTTERGMSSSVSIISNPSDTREMGNNNLTPNPASPKAIMSDSGVYLDSVRTTQQQQQYYNGFVTSRAKDNDNRLGEESGLNESDLTTANSTFNGAAVRTSDEDSASCSSCEMGRNSDVPRPYCSMHALRRKIANQKALIMKNLEMNVSKSQLDEQIVELQELQRRLIAMEKELLESPGDAENDQCGTYFQRDNDMSYELSANDCMEESSYVPSMTRSCPSMRDFPEAEHFITIPSFVIRGAGKQTHYEYEVRIALPDGKLNILRRYSRFRELHLSMKHCYGAKISALPFPRREIFSSNSESVAKHRRRLLELYLRRLFVVCTKIPQCPIYEGPGGPGLTRATLSQLSPFFKKGLFENGKHGTG
ncbi:kinesin-like protein Klp98A [Bactrocera neohumeralis]|uniref:kinesin-like protein Klp98A n=1 Tax=Bactrocera neohumeralis TaxID=98809 RepID=UPI0021668E75|nr:kinesin-like protein Klp98A [Bactrocera neohumeralis]